MKKKSLTLDALKVKSFLTTLDLDQHKTVIAGMNRASNPILNGCDDESCPSDAFQSFDRLNTIQDCNGSTGLEDDGVNI